CHVAARRDVSYRALWRIRANASATVFLRLQNRHDKPPLSNLFHHPRPVTTLVDSLSVPKLVPDQRPATQPQGTLRNRWHRVHRASRRLQMVLYSARIKGPSEPLGPAGSSFLQKRGPPWCALRVPRAGHLLQSFAPKSFSALGQCALLWIVE